MIMIACGSAFAAVLTPPAAVGGEARSVDYLYMEPNEGGSSAGHVAVAFGNRTYAFQRSPKGRLVLERDVTEHARWRYAVLGNRPIHRTRVAVSPDTYERLREGFNRRYLLEREELAQLDRLAARRDLLRVLVARARAPGQTHTLPVEAAGYFARPATGASAAALAALRASVAAEHGSDFVARRLLELRTTLAALRPDATVAADADRFAERYTAALGGIVALETLRDASALDPAAVRILGDAPLTADEAAALARYAGRLATELPRLAASARPDFGFPLLVGMARLAAIERSLAVGRLVVLDAFAPDARRLPYEALRRNLDAARGLRDDACADLDADRRQFAATTAPGEGEYADLERAANRCDELRRALAEGRDLRLADDAAVPARAAPVPVTIVPALAPARLAAAERAATEAADAAVRAYDDRHRYDLVRRNCVTETFRTIEAVLGPEADAALGGRIGVDAWHAIPAVAASAVRRRWRVTASDTTPSHRQARVAALARSGNPLVVRLRESNVLTSTVYRPSRDDSTFLFFTDDVLWLRPVLGAANLGVGIGASLVGLLQAPVDRAAGLEAGLRGILWSLPELVFLNVRKGSYDHVARHDLPTALPWRESPPPSPR